MSKKAPKQDLEELHGLVARELAKRIRAGEWTAADMNVARAFLKDNGIESLLTPENPLGQLKGAVTDNLPFPDAGVSH